MNIAVGTLKAIGDVLIKPPFVLIILWISIVLYKKNRKVLVMQRMIVGNSKHSAFDLTISQVGLGIIAGIVGSFILSFLGVVFKNQVAIEILFLISIMLMLFKPRFICFSYSGAILGLVSGAIKILSDAGVITEDLGYLQVDIATLITMIAVLHIVEGVLVMIDGKTAAIPVFTKRDNKIIGGFALKRYWPIPIAILLMLKTNDITFATNVIEAPNFWHQISVQSFELLKNATIAFTAFYGVIGYNTVTFTKSKEEKAFSSGIFIIMFGAILLVLSYIGRNIFIYQMVIVILMPILHELMLRIQIYLEDKAKPKYISKKEGLMVLEVAPNSPAEEMGIKSGDLLVEMNNKRIESENDVVNNISNISNFIWFKIKEVKGDIKEVSYNKMNKSKRLGIVFVPRGMPDASKVMKFDTEKFKEVLDKVVKKDKEKK